MTDEALRAGIERARLGEADAFAEVFRAFEEDVARVCRRLLGSADEARDASHEVFLRARRSLQRYDAERPFRPWLLAIAGNHCIDVLRRRSLERSLFVDDAFDEEQLRTPGPSPLGALQDAREREALSRAIEELPEKYRLPIALRYFNGLDNQAIGVAIGVSRAQVGTLLFRAKRLLRESFAKQDGPLEDRE